MAKKKKVEAPKPEPQKPENMHDSGMNCDDKKRHKEAEKK